LYGVVLLCAAIAYYILTVALLRQHGGDSAIAAALKSESKEKISLVLYLAAIPLAWLWAWAACALYVAVAIMWLVPDRRIEKALAGAGEHQPGIFTAETQRQQ
jgi:uncharacterized membrane protein